ncbi:hypothetical protein ACFC8N_43100 [Streptomyces sp. NPDC055966]|uniref:hypothetical protein n=1 Tax=Streptomyces sp. NPDC055966 TaxID=3345669 RepID=UPI0035DC410B
MPISRHDQERVDHLKKAAAHLRQTGAPEELAETVEFVLTDEGANFVNRLRWSGAAQENPNLALSMPTVLRDQIKAGAKAAGKSLPAQAVVALNSFLDGTYMPFDPREENLFRASGRTRSNLNVRVNADLRQRVDAHGQQLKEDGVLDWAPSTPQVLKAWFAEKFASPMPKKQ